MLGLSFVDSLGIIGGIVFLAIILLFALRPLRVHVTVRHERDDDGHDKEE